MYVRALIVVLAILNAGVALWWALRPAPSPPAPPPATASGVASLQLLLTPAPPAAAPAAEPAPATPAAAANVAAPKPAIPPSTDRCVRLGPYPDQASAETARTAAGGVLRTPRVREVAEASSFRVMLNGVGDRESAQAVIARIKAAGLRDYYVVGNGGQNAIALGQYRSREGAERRQSELAAAGFQAEVMPSGGGATGSRWWIEARAAGDEAALRGLHAPSLRSLDCATLR
ncbi:MAG TPA: SPOR domain-containing protein [Stenotrophomonas sp.]|nr:SPOR domain-containing protein [Stenotrophomonas sp.]